MTPILRAVQTRHWCLVAAVAVVALVTAGVAGATSVVAGGAVIGLSSLLTTAGLGAMLRRGVRLAIAFLFAKLLLLLGLVWVMLQWGLRGIDPGAFALGVTCFPVAAVWQVISARKD